MVYNNCPFIKPYLTTKSLAPENQEMPINFLDVNITPDEYFFRRNHFPYPSLNYSNFLLPIHGEVERPMVFHYTNLLLMPYKSLLVVIECAGNKRAYFEPKVYGEQWKDGAINQGLWRGVPLKLLLKMAGIKDSAKEVVFEGHDTGHRKDMKGNFSYARSLPIEKAMHPDTIIAYAYNGRPIPYKHGYPLRLIVPGWYGMASVKWLKGVRVIDHKFEGPFQTVDYVYYPNKEDDSGKKPVTTINLNSTIQQPLDMSKLDIGIHRIKGIAYTGEGNIAKVEISLDSGVTWNDTLLNSNPSQPYSWTPWEYKWKVNEKGEYTIMARAKDSYGRTQPMEAEWNRKGYGYNAIARINVKVE